MHVSLVRLAFAVVVCGLLGCSKKTLDQPPSAQPKTELSSAGMCQDLRQYHDVVLDAWAYLDWNRTHQQVDITRTRDELLARITDDTTPGQFALLLREFAAALKEGHSEVFLGALKEPLSFSWPIGFALVGDDVMVAYLHWLADNPGVDLGDRLVKVNGKPVEEYLQSRLAQTSASTDAARKLLAVDRLHWCGESSVKLTFEKSDASVFEATFECQPDRIDFRYRKHEDFCTYSSLDKGITHIRIRSFAWNNDAFSAATTDAEREQAISGAKAEIDQAFKAAADSSGIILDLRDNGGGFDLLSIYVAQHLVPGDFIYFETERRYSKSIRSLPGYRDMEASAFATRHPQKPRMWKDFTHFDGRLFDGPLVVLINERCFSSTDNLCAFLQDMRPQTTFVGRPTNGGTGEPVIVATLRNCGAKIQLCVSCVYSPTGRMIEGAGTRPDVFVQRDRESVIKRQDLDLKAALKVFGN